MTRQATVQATLLALALAALAPAPTMAQVPTGRMEALRPDQQRFFELYKELVEMCKDAGTERPELQYARKMAQ